MKFFQSFHHASKNTERVFLHQEKGESPKEELPDSKIKKYERFTSFALPQAQASEMRLTESLSKRTSGRSFDKDLSLQKLSNILHYSLGIKKTDKPEGEERMYPSAGRRFPLETYLFVLRPVGELEEGVYHYFPREHALYLVKKIIPDELFRSTLTMYDFAKDAKVAIMMTADFERTVKKYGDRGYRFTLLEAGMASHTITLLAAAEKIDAVHMGGVIDTTVEAILDIDGTNESLVHSVFIG